ncbi:hypothetical protein M3A49_05405 [Paraburkholderia sp. CNPSo 3076]|uniref:hypothetical protein n=1 Tax=Paraburkholderia sp. CNPSo 3076 TaxID=2940936 RepID=UPI002257BD79|nr:hypothetical protein [Paraburkholderia sp. CNPSo 3076]MCX5538939.1 hypothetical protein [Paraburkholderia sp. CNPSo 3076]
MINDRDDAPTAGASPARGKHGPTSTPPGVFLSLDAEFAKIGEAQTYHKGIIDVLYLGGGSFISKNQPK